MSFLADTLQKVDKIYREKKAVLRNHASFPFSFSRTFSYLSSDSLELHFVLVHCCPRIYHRLTSFLMPEIYL